MDTWERGRPARMDTWERGRPARMDTWERGRPARMDTWERGRPARKRAEGPHPDHANGTPVSRRDTPFPEEPASVVLTRQHRPRPCRCPCPPPPAPPHELAGVGLGDELIDIDMSSTSGAPA